jgi:hypothetical protein
MSNIPNYFGYNSQNNGTPLLTMIGIDAPTSNTMGSTKYYSTELGAYGLIIRSGVGKNTNNMVIGRGSSLAFLQHDGLALSNGQIQLRLFNGNDSGDV